MLSGVGCRLSDSHPLPFSARLAYPPRCTFATRPRLLPLSSSASGGPSKRSAKTRWWVFVSPRAWIRPCCRHPVWWRSMRAITKAGSLERRASKHCALLSESISVAKATSAASRSNGCMTGAWSLLHWSTLLTPQWSKTSGELVASRISAS